MWNDPFVREWLIRAWRGMDLPWRYDKYCYMLHLAPLSSLIHAHMHTHTHTHTHFKSIQISCPPQWRQVNCFFFDNNLITIQHFIVIIGMKLIVWILLLLTNTHTLIHAEQQHCHERSQSWPINNISPRILTCNYSLQHFLTGVILKMRIQKHFILIQAASSKISHMIDRQMNQ